MDKKVFLKDLQDLLSSMKMQLKPYGYDIKLVGGLRERGCTSHDVDLDISMPNQLLPSEEVFLMVNRYGNEFFEKYNLELDVNFLFRGKPRYKLDKGGFFEYQDDGSLEPTSA
jgi:hypothetical protein